MLESENLSSDMQIMVAILFFLVPSGLEKGDMLMDWGTCKKLHWDVLILLGGGKFELWLFMLI